MLFIREYDTKSLDRSSVSMIDKYNVRLNKVGELLNKLSSLINNLLSLIRDIRTLLGQSKQRIYDNLDQIKEVIDGNDITGTEPTIRAIEGALKTGDKAIDEAEAQLEGVAAAASCNEEYVNDANGTEECGETCNEIPTEENCTVCVFSNNTQSGTWGDKTDTCQVCAHNECNVNLTCSEEAYGTPPGETCVHSVTWIEDCNETIQQDGICSQTTCNHHSSDEVVGPGCTHGCNHSSACQQSPMPENCTYTCTDGDGCLYGGDDCTYGSVCQHDAGCNQSDCGEYDCGEPCGETCHMTTNDEDCSESSCGECSDELSDDDYYGSDDNTDTCGEDCGDSCGL